jgi:hypothetical protein
MSKPWLADIIYNDPQITELHEWITNYVEIRLQRMIVS